MPLTIEQLMQPRRRAKVPDMEATELYPGSPFKMGAIIEFTKSAWFDNLFFCYMGKVGDRKKFVLSFFDKYPHLFEPVQWWEERRAEDMPEYIKNKLGAVYKVTKHFNDDLKNSCDIDEDKYNGRMYRAYEPATEDEYLEYQKQKTQHITHGEGVQHNNLMKETHTAYGPVQSSCSCFINKATCPFHGNNTVIKNHA